MPNAKKANPARQPSETEFRTLLQGIDHKPIEQLEHAAALFEQMAAFHRAAISRRQEEAVTPVGAIHPYHRNEE